MSIGRSSESQSSNSGQMGSESSTSKSIPLQTVSGVALLLVQAEKHMKKGGNQDLETAATFYAEAFQSPHITQNELQLCFNQVNKINDLLAQSNYGVLDLLGCLYADKRVTMQDREKALFYFLHAHKLMREQKCDSKIPKVWNKIGAQYQYGPPTIKNQNTAEKWFVLAALRGNKFAIDNLNKLYPGRSAQSLAESMVSATGLNTSELIERIFQQINQADPANEVRTRLQYQENLELPLMGFNNSPLHTMIQLGETELALALLNAGADSCALDTEGRSALHVAARYNRVEILTDLLKKPVKLQIDLQDKLGMTALYMAARYNHATVVDQLLKSGANPHLPHTNGVTPLHVAAHNGHQEACAQLIQAGAVVDSQNERGNTPLHSAIRKNKMEVAKLLLLHNASPNILNHEKKTPMDVGSPAIFHTHRNENFSASEKINIEIDRLKNNGSNTDLNKKKQEALAVLSKIINDNPYRPLSINVRDFKAKETHYNVLKQQDTIFHNPGAPTISQRLVDSFDNAECGKYAPGGQLTLGVDDLVDEFMHLNPDEMQQPSSSTGSTPSTSSSQPSTSTRRYSSFRFWTSTTDDASAPPQPGTSGYSSIYPTLSPKSNDTE